MKYSRLLIALLLLATVLVDGAVLTMVQRQAGISRPVLFLVWALQVSQVNLATVWLVLGEKWAPLRLAVAVLVVASWSWTLSALPDPTQIDQWAVLLTAQMAAVSAPLLVARSIGVRIVARFPASRRDNSTRGPKRLQFSIGNTLAWTTALAVVLSTWQCVYPDGWFPLGTVLTLSLRLDLLGRAAVVLTAVWATLGTRRPAIRVITLLAATLLVFVGLFLTKPLTAIVGCLELPLLIGPLLVFRVAGYRLETRGKTNPQRSAAGPHIPDEI